MAIPSFRKTAAQMTVAVGTVLLAASPALAQHKSNSNNSSFGGFAAGQDTQSNFGKLTGGSSFALAPTASIALPKAGGQFEQGTLLQGRVVSGGSTLLATPNVNLGPAPSVARDGNNVGGFSASQAFQANIGKITGGSFVGIAPSSTVALGRAGGNYEQSTLTNMRTISGGSEVIVAPTLTLGPATKPSGLNMQ